MTGASLKLVVILPILLLFGGLIVAVVLQRRREARDEKARVQEIRDESDKI